MATQMTPEEIQAAFDAYNDELLRTGKVTKDTADAFNDAKAGVKNYTYQLNQSLKQLGNSVLDLGTAFKDGKQGASVYNNSIKAGADAVESFAAKFGILGKILGAFITAGAKYVVAVNEQSDKLFESYQQLSRTGAAGASGMKGVFQSMQDFGYNIEQLGEFGNLIKQNSESLAQFGGTVFQGTKTFAGVSKGIQSSGLQTEFMRMGMSVNDINQGIAGYISLQSRLGATQNKTQQQLTQGAAEYLKQQDLLTKLTGKNADAIQSEEKARLADQQYRVVMRELEKKALAGDTAAGDKILEIQKAMAQLGPEMQNELKQALTGFVGAGKSGEALFRRNADAFRYASDPLFRAGRYLDKVANSRVLDQMASQAKLGQYDPFGNFAEQADIEAKRRAGSFEEQERLGKLEIDNQKKGADKAVAAQVAMRQEQMSITKSMQTFINQGINPTTVAMQKLSGAVDSVTSKIPGTGPTAGTSGTGRGSEAGPGFFGRSPVRGTGQGVTFGSGVMGKIIEAESGGRNVGTVGSSAFGVAQFTKGTFEDVASRAAPGSILHGKTFADYKKDVNVQTAALAALTQSNAGILSKAGVSTDDASIYLAHFLGAGTAAKVLNMPDNTLLTSVLPSNVFSANPNVFRNVKTVGQLKAWAAAKMKQAETSIAKKSAAGVPSMDVQAPVVASSSGGGGGAATSAPGTLFGVPIGGPSGSASMSGPNDSYKPAISGTAPDTKTSNAGAEGSTQASAGKNSADLQVITIAKLDELIGLTKVNNDQNKKILQQARN